MVELIMTLALSVFVGVALAVAVFGVAYLVVYGLVLRRLDSTEDRLDELEHR